MRENTLRNFRVSPRTAVYGVVGVFVVPYFFYWSAVNFNVGWRLEMWWSGVLGGWRTRIVGMGEMEGRGLVLTTEDAVWSFPLRLGPLGFKETFRVSFLSFPGAQHFGCPALRPELERELTTHSSIFLLNSTNSTENCLPTRTISGQTSRRSRWRLFGMKTEWTGSGIEIVRVGMSVEMGSCWCPSRSRPL
jgi:hypothetical protein